jgi:hypothetical protein
LAEVLIIVSLEDLLRINDIVNNVIAKYQDIQKGLYNTHYEVNTDGHATPQPSEDQGISLIDLDDMTSTPPLHLGDSPGQSATNVMDELSHLFNHQVTTSSISSSPANQLGPDSVLSQPFQPAPSPQSTPVTANDMFDFTSNTSTSASVPSRSLSSSSQQGSHGQEQGKICLVTSE